MRVSDTTLGGSYLKAPDLPDRPVSVIAGRSRMEDVGGEDKLVVYFEGKQKGLVLNKTNAGAIVSAYGDETDDWAGKPLELYVARVMFQGRMVDAIRVRVPAPQAAPQQPAPQPPAQSSAPDFDDDIPF